MNSYSSINPSSASASGSVTPATKSLAGLPLQLPDGFLQIPSHELRIPIHAVQGARHHVLFCRVDRPRERLHPLGHPVRPLSRPCHWPLPGLHHFVGYPAEQQGIGLREGLGRMTMQVFVRDHDAMIAAPVQCDVDGLEVCGRGEPALTIPQK